MEFLAGLFALVGLLFLLMAIAGLIVPSKFKDKSTGEIPKRSSLFTGYFLIAVIAFAVAGWLTPKDTTPANTPETAKPSAPAQNSVEAKSSAKPEEKPAAPAEKDLGITPDEYAAHFNENMKILGQPFRIKPEVKTGMVNDTFTVQLNDRLAIVGAVAKSSGKVKSVMLMGGGDGTMKSGVDIISVAVSVIAAAFPDIDRKQIGPEVMELIKQADANDKHEAEHILNGVKMYHARNEVMGNVFGVEPAE